MLKLEILICTIDAGIFRVPNVLQAPHIGVGYLVSWQQCGDTIPELPAALTRRDDVRVIVTKGRGLSANRNNALTNAHGELIVLADDDVRYPAGAFDRIISAFVAHPEADIITFQATDYHDQPVRPYPTMPYTYDRRPYGSYVCSWEIVCRRETRLPRFDERFGIGAPHMSCGEEEIFIYEAYRRGLRILYLPEIIVRTDADNTGMHFLTSIGVQCAKGGVLCVMHGPIGATIRCIKFATRLPRGMRLGCLRHMFMGICYALHTS